MGKGLESVAATLDLSKRSSSPRRDEFARASLAFNTLMDRMQTIVVSVRTSSESVSTATGQIAAGNAEVSIRTEEQAASLEETSSTMIQLTETVKNNADNAHRAKALAANAMQFAEAGGETIHEMLSVIARISASTGQISEITGLIQGIAFQTNILALNASVEAARAGEHGRGFAVVAAEVRSLAQRCSSAAKDIEVLITSLLAIVQDGSERAGKVRAAMTDIKAAVEDASQIVSEIATASAEQSHALSEVNQTVIQMDKMTQDNAALIEQAASAARQLEAQAAQLKFTVASFRLSSD